MWTAAFADPWSLIITESKRGREWEVEKKDDSGKKKWKTNHIYCDEGGFDFYVQQ